MSIALLVNVPINVKFVETGTDLSVDPLEALFGDYYTDWSSPDGLIVELDASLREGHVLEADSAEHPIEDGSLVSDNYTPRPQRLTIEGTITDTPVQFLSFATSGTGGIGAISNTLGIMPTRINAWFVFKELWKSGRPFDVATGLDLYRSMRIERFETNQSASIGKQLLFTASLKQAQIIKKEAGSTLDDLYTTPDDVGYLTSQIPDATALAAAAVSLGVFIESAATQ